MHSLRLLLGLLAISGITSSFVELLAFDFFFNAFHPFKILTVLITPLWTQERRSTVDAVVTFFSSLVVFKIFATLSTGCCRQALVTRLVVPAFHGCRDSVGLGVSKTLSCRKRKLLVLEKASRSTRSPPILRGTEVMIYIRWFSIFFSLDQRVESAWRVPAGV
jgi:hypothetical protein